MASRFVSSGTILGDGTSKPIITPAATSQNGTASASKDGDGGGDAMLKAATQSFSTAGVRGDAGVARQEQQQPTQPRETPEDQPRPPTLQTYPDRPSSRSPPPPPPDAEAENLDPAALARRREWAAVQATLLSERAEREAKRKAEMQGEGEKSLFAILQENKAAKQAAFEEANKIRNQFRALDDDEIEFLDEVAMKKKDEERLKREEELEGMRKFQEAQRGRGKEGDAGAGDGGEGEEEVKWEAAGRKRKREKDGGKGVFKGLKRKESMPETEGETGIAEKGKADSKSSIPAATSASKSAAAKASLVAYGSDSDDD